MFQTIFNRFQMIFLTMKFSNLFQAIFNRFKMILLAMKFSNLFQAIFNRFHMIFFNDVTVFQNTIDRIFESNLNTLKNFRQSISEISIFENNLNTLKNSRRSISRISQNFTIFYFIERFDHYFFSTFSDDFNDELKSRSFFNSFKTIHFIYKSSSYLNVFFWKTYEFWKSSSVKFFYWLFYIWFFHKIAKFNSKHFR